MCTEITPSTHKIGGWVDGGEEEKLAPARNWTLVIQPNWLSSPYLCQTYNAGKKYTAAFYSLFMSEVRNNCKICREVWCNGPNWLGFL